MVRIKHRYLLLNILYPDPSKASPLQPVANGPIPYTVQFRAPTADALNGKILIRLIRDGVADLFGDYGAGKVSGSLQVKYFSAATSTAIVRVSRDHYRLVWAALTCITHLPKPLNQPCVMQVVRVSGTVKKAEEEAIRRARISIRRAQAQARGSALLANGGAEVAMTDALDDHGDEDPSMLGGIVDRDEPGDVDEDDDDDEED